MRSTTKRVLSGVAAVAAAALLMSGCSSGDGGGTDIESGAQFSWDNFSGDKIRVLAYDNAWGNALKSKVPEFEKKTGIEVDLDLMQFAQARQRATIELQARNSDLDVFIGPPQEQGITFEKNGYYVDLGELAENSSITSPDYDIKDFRPNLMTDQTIDGTLVGIPTEVLVSMLFYRADLLDKAGIDVPTTFDELTAAAKKLDHSNGVRAWSARGKSMSTVFASFLYGSGASWVNDGGQEGSLEPGFDNADGVNAVRLYTSLLNDFAPDGAVNRSSRETTSLMASGKIAMMTDVSSLWQQVADPESSSVADDVEFAPVPGGDGGAVQAYTTEAASISSFSENKEASWLFIQWATSSEMIKSLQQNAGVAGARESVTEFGDEVPKSWVSAYLDGLEDARPMTPSIPNAGQVRDSLESAIQSVLTGKAAPQAAIDTMAGKFTSTVNR